MSGNGNGFDEARRREGELNPRQREVLDLLVAGKTNAEIGETLGITLDGAKWNVSEILTKLGLDSREDAADYWRWRNRGVRKVARTMRGVFAGISLRAALGAAGVVVVGVSALAIWLAAGTDERAATGGTPGSFYLEASVVVRSDPSPQDIGRSIAGSATPTGQPTENKFALRWWYQDVDHARWELESLTPSLDQKTVVAVYDGKEQWLYGSARNSYTEDPLPPMPPEVKFRPIGLSAVVGPVGAGRIDEFMQQFTTRGNGAEWKRTGESTILGRRVEIVELERPAAVTATAVASASAAAGTTTVVLTPEPGVNRFWIDPATMFVLRNELTGSQSFVAEVTKLEMGAAIPAEKLRFQPPAGSVRTTSGATSGGSSGTSVSIPATGAPSIPPGLLPITYIPSGYRTGGVQRASDNQGIVSYGIEFVGSGGDHVSIDQRGRADGVPETLKTSDVVSLPGGVEGYRRTDGDLRTLAFAKDGIAVAISATGLPFEELERMAAGMLAP
jgi:DNA-binding CsgD family transcriptional regulator/outer membrane lipoprotein-sorting protein